MFKKLNVCLVLGMAVLMPLNQALAETASYARPGDAAKTSDIMNAVDQLNYQLSVVWDQKDPVVYRAAVNEFITELNQLKAKGMPADEILTTIKGQVLSPQAGADLDRLVSLVSQHNLSVEQTQQLATDFAMKAQHDGAHYAGDAAVAVAFLTVIVVAVIVVAVWATWPHHNCTGNGCVTISN